MWSFSVVARAFYKKFYKAFYLKKILKCSRRNRKRPPWSKSSSGQLIHTPRIPKKGVWSKNRTALVSTNAIDVRTSHIFNIFQTSKTFLVSTFLLVPACFTLAYSEGCCLAPSFSKKGVMEGGWLKVGSSHFNEKFSLL